MNTLKQLDAWHKTTTGFLVFGLFELAAAYGFFSLAVNSGSLWQWVLTFVLIIGALRNLFLAIKPPKHGDKK